MQVQNDGRPARMRRKLGTAFRATALVFLVGLRRKLGYEARTDGRLLEARERLRLLLESTDAGMYGIDTKARCTFINPAAARMLGYDSEELIGKPVHARIHHTRPDGTSFPIEECPIAGTLRSGTVVRTDAEVFWRKDGSSFPVDYTAAPIVSDGTVTGVVVTFVDVTHRKRSEQTREFLAEATRVLSSSLDYEQTLRTVADLAVPRLGDWCVVDVLESDNRLRRLALVHRDPDKLPLVEDLSRKRPPRLDASIGAGKVIRTGEPELYTEVPRAVLVSATGGDAEQLRAIDTLDIRSLMSVPIVIRGKPAAAIVSAMTDSGRRFTEDDLRVAEELARRASIAIENAMLYREAEEARHRAEAADQAKSEFLAAMSHELRTPLNAISGYTELLQVGVHGPVTPKQREALERIQRSQKTLLGLINDILNFSKLHAGFIEVRTEDVRVEEILTTIDAWVEPQLHAKKLRYRYEGCAPDLVARGDREKIQQVMLNLLSNAVKFTPEGGEISVRCETDGDAVTILVSDTGPGIPEDKHEAIFEPFVQIGRHSGGQGTGLGLAISRDLARAMHGDLRVRSADGKGSTFLFSLPLSAKRRTG